MRWASRRPSVYFFRHLRPRRVRVAVFSNSAAAWGAVATFVIRQLLEAFCRSSTERVGCHGVVSPRFCKLCPCSAFVDFVVSRRFLISPSDPPFYCVGNVLGLSEYNSWKMYSRLSPHGHSHTSKVNKRGLGSWASFGNTLCRSRARCGGCSSMLLACSREKTPTKN